MTRSLAVAALLLMVGCSNTVKETSTPDFSKWPECIGRFNDLSNNDRLSRYCENMAIAFAHELLVEHPEMREPRQ